jgi:hypothetical protein
MFAGTCCLPLQGSPCPVPCCSTLRMRVAGSSEKLVTMYQPTYHHISEDINLSQYCCQQLQYFNNVPLVTRLQKYTYTHAWRSLSKMPSVIKTK